MAIPIYTLCDESTAIINVDCYLQESQNYTVIVHTLYLPSRYHDNRHFNTDAIMNSIL